MMKQLSKLHYEHEVTVRQSFMQMVAGIVECDFNTIEMATEKLCQEFGFRVEFDNQDDFDEFMLDEVQSVKLSKAR